jgi:hypothetical protein
VNSLIYNATITNNTNGTVGGLNITDGSFSGDTQTCAYVYDDLNRLLTNCGSEGNLITVSGVTVTFDALGRRLEVDISGTYEQMVYPPFAPTYQMALAEGLTAEGIRMPLPGGGEAIFNSAGLAQCRHPNWQGSQVVLSWPSGSPNPNAGGAFTPFGEKYATYPAGFNVSMGISRGCWGLRMRGRSPMPIRRRRG